MDMQFNTRDRYMLLRKKKKIKLKTIADHIGCSISLLSKYEKGTADMANEKVRRYRAFIDSYQPDLDTADFLFRF